VTIVEFLTARLADPVGAGDGSTECWGVGEYHQCDEWSEWHERTITAQRVVVSLHKDDYTDTGDIDTDAEICTLCQEAWPCRTLELLASIYSDHPDFDQAWVSPQVSTPRG
jgi:hypothetical protein